jgi:hypothetical protein
MAHARQTVRLAGLWAFACLVVVMPAGAQSSTPRASEPFVVEYYYQVQWGHQQEFLSLFKKNHLPILLKEKEKGRLLDITLTTPRYHATEEGRWDYRVTLTFRDLAAAFGEGALTEAETRQLYPDQPTFQAEEERRFAILLAHWDVPVTTGPFKP